ncbi:unnamed protein product [Dovyalis caffra]|uniref:Uncharacterized protein n=1 Tax=Dovyalis caffra TaxID=77055 RepID=A0AAV1SJN4_9ROSI|nr:unnamed protein product [Dovyalis caffra]
MSSVQGYISHGIANVYAHFETPMENHSNTALLLDRKDIVLVKPAKPTPSKVLSFSTIDNDPNLEILCHSVYVYKANSVSSNNGNADHDLASKLNCQADPACVIKDAISKVLVHYYPLAGKLKRDGKDRKLHVNCNAEGVPFLEATANCKLASLKYLDGIDAETAKEFVFDFPSKSDFGYHPLLFQVTKFSCGGFAIGMGLSHSVCDGFGASQLFRALAELASGKAEPTVKPVWERERLVVKPTQGPLLSPVDKTSLAASPYSITDDILHECFLVNAETIKRLKTSLVKECGDHQVIIEESFTTLEVLGAYIWRSRFRAFKLNPDGNTLFCLAMGIRHLVNPPLPSGYYGNAFVGTNVVMMGRDLHEGPLSRAAKLIKESKKHATDTENIWNQIGILDKVRELNFKIDSDNGASMILTDWRQLGLLEEVDFGWKGLVNMIPVPLKMFGFVYLCIFLPPCNLVPSTKGGVRVLVSLPRAVMPKFKEEMHALSQLRREDVVPMLEPAILT